MSALAFAAPKDFMRHRGEPSASLDGVEWVVVRDRELLVSAQDGCSWPRSRPDLELKAIQNLGKLGDTQFVAAAVAPQTDAPCGWQWVGMRALFGVLDPERLSLAGRGVQLLDWELCHAFCGRCGSPTGIDRQEGCRKCENCGFVSYPRIEPCIIVAVVREGREGREILLARSTRAGVAFHSVLAGFVEPGETLEQCAKREVFEEVGIGITNLRYVASQPWPFPRSLMIGFIADYASGSITIDPSEIASADWFPLDEMPTLPSTISIARVLIEHVREQTR